MWQELRRDEPMVGKGEQLWMTGLYSDEVWRNNPGYYYGYCP